MRVSQKFLLTCFSVVLVFIMFITFVFSFINEKKQFQNLPKDKISAFPKPVMNIGQVDHLNAPKVAEHLFQAPTPMVEQRKVNVLERVDTGDIDFKKPLKVSSATNNKYIGMDRPKSALLEGSRENKNWKRKDAIVFVDGKPYWPHADIERIDTFVFNEKIPYPFVINYAWWREGDGCELHIIGDIEKSAKWHEIKNFHHYRRLIRQGSVAIDIGAHAGDTTVRFAPYAGLTIAFEPNPETFIPLQTQIDINPQFMIHGYNLAVSHTGKDYTDRWCYRCNGGANQKGAKNCFDAHLVNLVDFLEKNYSEETIRDISFIKADCEGFDLQVLRTFVPLFKYTRPIIKIEWFVNVPSQDKPFREEAKKVFKLIDYVPYDEQGLKAIDIDTFPHQNDMVLYPRENQKRPFKDEE